MVLYIGVGKRIIQPLSERIFSRTVVAAQEREERGRDDGTMLDPQLGNLSFLGDKNEGRKAAK